MGFLSLSGDRIAASKSRLVNAGSAFTPRSITGLALWLDASDASSLYTTDAGAVTAVSSPTDISGCVLWLDGADSSAASMTLNGSLVETWKDKSGSGRDFTAASTARPTLTPSAINSRGAVTFNGSTNTLTGNTAAQDVIRNIAGYTVFAAIRATSVAAGERLAFGVGSTVLFRIGQQDSRPFIGGRRVLADSLESITESAGAIAANTPFIQSAVVNHASQSLTGLRNGAVFATDSTYMGAGNSENTASAVSVGTQGGGTYGFWNGDIAEVIVFNTALSTTDRARVEAYLAAKWGISGVHAPATATSDPVGAWLDKSGNARHATQSTAGNRPTISANTQGGKKMLGFDGANGRLTISFPVTAADPVSMIAVARRGATTWGGGGGGGYGSFLNSTGGSSGGPQLRVDTGNIEVIGGTNKSTTIGSNVGVGSCAIIEGMVSSVATSLYVQGALVDSDAGAGSITTAGTRTSIGAWNDGTQGGGPLNGDIAELICYRASLSTSQRQKLERYLAAKWGITLAPQVSNADAQNWIDRVYANGGTVSSSTAAAVNTLCIDLENASLRDRFYRLNLFCGTGLNAALVPLYRGPSLGGTQYGNTTDTNVGPFVSGDYAETGASGGLLGNGTSKYLNTGLSVSNIGTAASGHVSVYHGQSSGTDVNRYYIGANDATTSNRFYLGTDSFASASVIAQYGSTQSASQSLSAQGHGTAGHRILSRETDSALTHYHNGAVVGTNNIGIPTTLSTAAFAVFATNRNGTVDRWHNSWIAAYSIGLGLNSTQAAAYRTIMQTFQTALGRNV